MELQSDEVLTPRRGDEVEFRDGNLVWFYCTVLKEANVDGLVEVFFPCDRTKELVDPKRLRLATADSSVHGARQRSIPFMSTVPSPERIARQAAVAREREQTERAARGRDRLKTLHAHHQSVHALRWFFEQLRLRGNEEILRVHAASRLWKTAADAVTAAADASALLTVHSNCLLLGPRERAVFVGQEAATTKRLAAEETLLNEMSRSAEQLGRGYRPVFNDYVSIPSSWLVARGSCLVSRDCYRLLASPVASRKKVSRERVGAVHGDKKPLRSLALAPTRSLARSLLLSLPLARSLSLPLARSRLAPLASPLSRRSHCSLSMSVPAHATADEADTLQAHRAKVRDEAACPSSLDVDDWHHQRSHTPALRPIAQFLHQTGAPVGRANDTLDSMMAQGASRSAYATRLRQTISVCEAMIRRDLCPNDLDPFHTYVGSMLCDRISGSTMNELREHWGCVTSCVTMRSTLERLMRCAAADTGVLPGTVSTCSTADNFGTLFQQLMGVLRTEVTTLWHLDVRESDLPVLINMSVPRYHALSIEWVAMEHTGLHTPTDFQASLESDQLLRSCVFAFVSAVDNLALPSLDVLEESSAAKDGIPGTDESNEQRSNRDEEAPGDAGRHHRTRRLKAVHPIGTRNVDITAIPVSRSTWAPLNLTREDDADAGVTDAADDAASADASNTGGLPSIWNRGVTVQPELDMNFAQKETIAFLVKLVRRRASRGGTSVDFICGDGAPTMKINSFIRASLCFILGEDSDVIDGALNEAAEVADGADEDTADANADEEMTESQAETAEALLSPELMAAVLTTVNLLGVFHAFMDIAKRIFKTIKSTLCALAPLWRDSIKKVQFFLSVGNISRCYMEVMAVAVGIARFFVDKFRESPYFAGGARTLDQFEEWLEKWGEVSSIVKQLHITLDLLVLLKDFRSAMRSGLLEAVELFLQQHLEIACGTGGDQYRQILTDFMVLLRCMPEKFLVLMEQHMFVDFGSHFKPADEFTEEIHHWLSILLGKAVPRPQVFKAQTSRHTASLSQVRSPPAQRAPSARRPTPPRACAVRRALRTPPSLLLRCVRPSGAFAY